MSKNEVNKPLEIINLHGKRIVLDECHRIATAKIKCYLCGNESENISDFSFCGTKGFAHPECLPKEISHESN